MKKFAIIFLLSLVSIAVNSQDLSCSDLKNGKFIYPALSGKMSVRKGGIQKSYSNDILEMIWVVKWIDECKYELICKKVINKSLPIHKGDRIVCTIIEHDQNCYITSNIFFNKANPSGVMAPKAEMCSEPPLMEKQ